MEFAFIIYGVGGVRIRLKSGSEGLALTVVKEDAYVFILNTRFEVLLACVEHALCSTYSCKLLMLCTIS